MAAKLIYSTLEIWYYYTVSLFFFFFYTHSFIFSFPNTDHIFIILCWKWFLICYKRSSFFQYDANLVSYHGNSVILIVTEKSMNVEERKQVFCYNFHRKRTVETLCGPQRKQHKNLSRGSVEGSIFSSDFRKNTLLSSRKWPFTTFQIIFLHCCRCPTKKLYFTICMLNLKMAHS